MKWIKVKLTDICKPKQWKNLPISEMTSVGFPVYGANGVIGKYKEYNHEFSTLAITCRGATCGTLNITEPKSYITSNAMALDKISEKVNQKFLYYALKKRGFKDIITGAAQPQITGEGLNKIVLNIPENLSDQIQIANILSKAETLISQRKHSIALLDEFLKSTFLEMFYTNPETESWNEVKFEELAEKKKASMRSGPFGSSLLHGEFTETGDVKVLGIDNVVSNRFTWKRSRCITQEKYQELKRYRVYPNDVLISIMATLGRTAVVPNDIPICINSKHLAAITLDKKIANPFFVAYAFHTHPLIVRQMSNNVKGAIMDGLNLTIIRSIKLKVPPIELQNRFGKIFNNTEVLQAQYQSSLQELENLYGSLSQRAFRGGLAFLQNEDEQPSDIVETEKTDLISEKIVPVVKEKKEKDEVDISNKSIKKIIPDLQPVATHRERNKQSYKIISTIKTHYRNRYFTFEEFSKKLIESGHDYKFEAIRSEIFNLLRENKLKQVFADAAFKSSFDKSDIDYKVVQELEERIYLTFKSQRK